MREVDIEPVPFARTYLTGLTACLEALPLERIAGVVVRLLKAYQDGRRVFIVGNGGSAATASHMACDLSKTVLGEQQSAQGLRAICLSDNVPLLTAWANDVGYEVVFARQLQGWIEAGDILIAITGSGNSPNIVEAAKIAREAGATVIGFLGFDGGQMKSLVDEVVLVESDNYGHIEDVHMILDHLITAYFRRTIALETGRMSLPFDETSSGDLARIRLIDRPTGRELR
jgi:D-sedoheptulose 7-phosphate isomerase